MVLTKILKPMKLEHQVVTIAIAERLKMIGFDEPCLLFTDGKKIMRMSAPTQTMPKFDVYYNAFNAGTTPGKRRVPFAINSAVPMWQDALDWFRTKHQICGWVEFDAGGYHFRASQTFDGFELIIGTGYDNYRDCRAALVVKLIEIIEKK